LRKVVESPFKTKHNIKVKLMLLAHMFQLDVPEHLRPDLQTVLETSPQLIDAMLSMAFMKAQQVQGVSFVVLRTMEVSQMLAQARRSAAELPIHQLPYIPLKRGKEFQDKKLALMQQMAQLDEAERRKACSFMSDGEYDNMRTVMDGTPMISITTEFEAHGEESISPNSMVTLRVKLQRYSTKQWVDMTNDGSWKALGETNNEPTTADNSGEEMDEDKINAMFAEMKRKKQAKKNSMTDNELGPVVYAPFFPGVRHERWWLIVTLQPRDPRMPPPILAAPQAITSLSTTVERDVQFQAPGVGKYNLCIQIKSADYAGFDARRQVLFEVKPPVQQKMVNHFDSDNEEED